MSGMGEVPDETWDSRRRCPHCAGEMRPIAWGYPDEELFQAGDRGDVFVGGCVIPEGPIPQWHCPACGRDVHLPEVHEDA